MTQMSTDDGSSSPGQDPRDENVSGPASEDTAVHMPSDVSDRVGFFDSFATKASRFFSNAWFFAFCVLLVLLWAPSYFVLGSLDTWQLIINTVTTIVTFLMVALLQNSQTRADDAVQDKLNAISAALGELMTQSGVDQDYVKELRMAVGLEDRESSSA